MTQPLLPLDLSSLLVERAGDDDTVVDARYSIDIGLSWEEIGFDFLLLVLVLALRCRSMSLHTHVYS